jgi:hypothetical protein
VKSVEPAQRAHDSNSLLNHLTEDHLTFKEIARAWSKVAGDNPEMLMEALVTAFWRGEFERGAQSALFILGKPVSKPFSASPPRRPSILEAAPRPGDYVISGGAIARVGEDLEPHPTAERERSDISREGIARLFYTPRGRRGITLGEPADFGGWSFDKRDLDYPNWRAEYEDFYRGLSTKPIEQWSTVPYDMHDHCSLWCIRRDDFARWYRASPLSAGASLTSFWPARASHPSQQFSSTDLPHTMQNILNAIYDAKKTKGIKWLSRRPKHRTPIIAEHMIELGHLARGYNRPSLDRQLRDFFKLHWPSRREEVEADIPEKTG